MHAAKIAGLLASALIFAAAADAQVPRGYTPQGADQQRLENNRDLSSAHFNNGLEALQAKNYQVAAGIFADMLRQDRNHADANFLMGVAQMGLEDWNEAKKYLEIAVRKSPKKPDPRSRLAVTLIKLGDIEAARAQREELVKLQTACKGNCRDAQFIDNGIAMVDGAMPKS